jgi:hypothetical protein
VEPCTRASRAYAAPCGLNVVRPRAGALRALHVDPAAALLWPAAPGRRRLPGAAAVPVLLRLPGGRGLERSLWRAVAPNDHHRAPPSRQARQGQRRLGPRLSFAKVAEFQRRGLIHFHAIFRLDGTDPAHPERTIAPPSAFTAAVLADAIRAVAGTMWFATVPHPVKPKGWDITWGAQVDPRVVRLTDDGEVTDVAVASYPAKYATKSTEPVGTPPGRITPGNASAYATPRTHQGCLIAACLTLGAHPHEDFQALRRWAHMFGYRGHFATKSRRYSTTMRALRAARRDWHRRQHLLTYRHSDQAVITDTSLQLAGRGWRTTGDALLALSAAARAREYRRIAREEVSVV